MQFSQLIATAALPLLVAQADFVVFLGVASDIVPQGAATYNGQIVQFFNNAPSCDDALNQHYGVGGAVSQSDGDPNAGVVIHDTQGGNVYDPTTSAIASLEWNDYNDGENIMQQVTDQQVGLVKIDSYDGGSTYNIFTVSRSGSRSRGYED